MQIDLNWKTRGTWLALSLLVLMAETTTVHGQKAIFLLRHAERVEYASPDGLLSEAGQARAQVLARVLKDAGVSAIYTTERKRTVHTAEPLTKALGIPPIAVDSSSPVQVTLDLIRTRNKDGIVAIVGHSNTVPAFLRALGHHGDVAIGEREHDDLFVIVGGTGGGPPTVLRLNY
jgi:broad specificity phosphatase PhoE